MGTCTSKPWSFIDFGDERKKPYRSPHHVCAVPYSSRIEKMRAGRSKLRTEEEITKFDIECSEVHWTQTDSATCESSSTEGNRRYFEFLKQVQQWRHFFKEYPGLVVGKKIAEGTQADIYEASINADDGSPCYDHVVKVLKGAAPLQAMQSQWPVGMLSARSNFKHFSDLPLLSVRGGTLLHDERLKGRFAFVMIRRWGDLRKFIDDRMVQNKPFTVEEATRMMLSIAQDLADLHDKHDILHRDLKASNVLVWNNSGESVPPEDPAKAYPRAGIASVVVDFECSVGVVGTGFWRAPEILQQLKERVPSWELEFTQASDVYSYGMTCYEIVTGCLPFEGIDCTTQNFDMVLAGKRPENLPHDLPGFLREIIVSCWHSDLARRPSFSDVCDRLRKGVSWNL